MAATETEPEIRRFSPLCFTVQQFIDIRPQQRLHQTRVCSLRPADGDHPFSAQLTRRKELTDGNDVLIIKMPDLFRQAHRLKEMDASRPAPPDAGQQIH
jgi:hypothetical protein